MTWIIATGVVLLVSSSALLAAWEAAVYSVGHPQLRALREEGFEGAEDLQTAHDREGRVRGTVALLSLLLGLLSIGLVVVLASRFGGSSWSWAALLFGAFAIAFVTAVVPRSLAARRPIHLALTSAPRLLTVERWTRLLFAPLFRVGSLLSGPAEDAEGGEVREFMELSEIGQQEGVVDPDEHLLVVRALRLDELTAFDVMTPRVGVFGWREDLRLDDIIDQLKTVPYSRVPVYRESLDDVTGILYVREAYKCFVAGNGQSTLAELCRDPFFVPSSLPLTQLLRDFQARRIHMGIVSDEYGGTDGIVTLEDVIEELVGEIVDETDIEDTPLMRLGRNEVVADASVDLREVNYALNVTLPLLEHRSLNGYILEEFGYVPDAGESLERSGVQIDVVEATDTHVVRVRLRRRVDAESAES